MDDFLQDANQNATQPDLGAQADNVDPASGEETPALVMEQQQTEGDDGISSSQEDPALVTEQEQSEGGTVGTSSQPSQEDPALVMEQEQTEDGVVGTSSQPSIEDAASAVQQTEGGSCASCQPSAGESQSGTGVEPSDS